MSTYFISVQDKEQHIHIKHLLLMIFLSPCKRQHTTQALVFHNTSDKFVRSFFYLFYKNEL